MTRTTAPRIVAFYSDHGIDVGSTPYWRLDWCVSDDYTTVRSTEPWRIDVSIPLAGGTLEITLDDALSVVESRHRGSRTGS